MWWRGGWRLSLRRQGIIVFFSSVYLVSLLKQKQKTDILIDHWLRTTVYLVLLTAVYLFLDPPRQTGFNPARTRMYVRRVIMHASSMCVFFLLLYVPILLLYSFVDIHPVHLVFVPILHSAKREKCKLCGHKLRHRDGIHSSTSQCSALLASRLIRQHNKSMPDASHRPGNDKLNVHTPSTRGENTLIDRERLYAYIHS